MHTAAWPGIPISENGVRSGGVFEGGICRVSAGTLSKDFAFYGLLDLLQRSVSIIMVPVYTRALSPTQYGDLDIILIASSVLFVLVELQFTAGFARQYYDRSARGEGGRFVGTAIVTRLIGGTAISGVVLALGHAGLIEYEFLPSFKGNAIAWTLAVLTISLTLTYDILLLQARMLRAKKWFALGSFSNVLVSCVFSAYFAIVCEWGITSVLLGLFIGKVIGLGLLVAGLNKKVTLCLEPEHFRDLMRYSWPLIPGFWLSFSSVYANRFIVYSEFGADENAILSICMKLVGVIGMFASAFQTAWQPLAMSHIGCESGHVFYVRSMRLFIAGSLASMYFMAALLDPLLDLLAPDAYGVVTNYFPMFAVGMVLSTCASSLQLGHQIARTTHWISISALTAMVINISILVVFSKHYGMFAAGLGWLCSYVASCLVTYYSAQSKYHIDYDLKAFALLGLGSALLLLTGYGTYSRLVPIWVAIVANAALGILLPWLVIKDAEMDNIKALMHRRRARSRHG